MEGKYYKTKESVNEYIKAAQGFDGKELIDKMNAYLAPQSSLLEIGSGPGTDWKILNETYNITGSDNSSEFINHLSSEYPSGEFLELDASTLATDKKFDGIYSNKVLHHLNDEELQISIKRQAELLQANGIICHSFWKGDGSEIFKGLFVNYHNEEILKETFSNYFEIIVLESYLEFEEGDSILLIARKK
ncbi:MAG: class I SAM-dependent methyltransferase [Vicingaceae bacterium]